MSESFPSLCHILADLTDSWGPVAWIIISEVFPLGLRAKGVSIGGSSNWLNNVRDDFHNLGRSETNSYLVRGGYVNLAVHRCITVRRVRKHLAVGLKLLNKH